MKKSIIIVLLLLLFGTGLSYAWQKNFFETKTNFNQRKAQNSDTETSILGNPSLDEAVTKFLLSEQQFSWKTGNESTNICVFQNLNPESGLFPIYIWIRCGEFKVTAGELKELSGTSLPIKIDYPNELSYYDITKFSFEAPRDGSLYDKDVKIIFPENVWPRLNFDSAPLNKKIWQTAEELLLNR